MKLKSLIATATLAALPALASAQVFDGFTNPVAVGGINLLTDAPSDGSSKARFFLSASLPGFKPFANLPLYVLGVGIDIRTLPGVGELADAAGAGVSIPALTYAFAGKQAVVQVGYSRAFTESAASGIYFGVGFQLTPPGSGETPAAGTRSAKHKAKQAEKAKAKAAKEAGPEK